MLKKTMEENFFFGFSDNLKQIIVIYIRQILCFVFFECPIYYFLGFFFCFKEGNFPTKKKRKSHISLFCTPAIIIFGYLFVEMFWEIHSHSILCFHSFIIQQKYCSKLWLIIFQNSHTFDGCWLVGWLIDWIT